MSDSFELTILLPDRVLLSTQATRLGGEAFNGSFVVLPRHIDFATALVPGIVYLQDAQAKETFVAIDDGILVKREDTVWISVLQAVCGDDLETLGEVVEAEFRQLDERQKQANTALTRLEASFMRSLTDMGRSRREFR